MKKKKRDGPEKKERGTVLKRKKEGRSLKEKNGDGPEKEERGTVLERKTGMVLKGEKRDNL